MPTLKHELHLYEYASELTHNPGGIWDYGCFGFPVLYFHEDPTGGICSPRKKRRLQRGLVEKIIHRPVIHTSMLNTS